MYETHSTGSLEVVCANLELTLLIVQSQARAAGGTSKREIQPFPAVSSSGAYSHSAVRVAEVKDVWSGNE